MANTKGKITESRIIDKSAYEVGAKLAESLKEATSEVNRLNNEFNKNKNTLQEFYKQLNKLNNKKVDSKSFKEVESHLRDSKKLNKKISVVWKEQEQLNRTLTTALRRKELAYESTNRVIQKHRFELNQINKKTRETAILSSKLASEYQKQSIKLNQLKRNYREVALTKGENSKEAKKLRKEIIKLDTALKNVDKNVGEFRRSVGNYSKAMTSTRKAVGSLMSVMGIAGGAYLFVNVMKDAFNRVRQFDKSMQNLAGVMRTSRKDIKDLESTIIDVAGTSVKTSTEIASLAESLTTLGKSKEEVKQLLKPVTDLGIGLETTGAEAGEFLIQVMNSFGAGTKEAQKYADVIASIRTSTSLDFQKMRDSFQYITPISKILNKDLAYTGAVVGLLADNGLKAESAGRLLATAQQRLAKEGKSLNTALNELNEAQQRGVKETELMALATKDFGVQGAKIGVILANNSEKIEENAQAIRNNTGALKDLTDRQLESLDAKLKILDSSWERFIFSIERGNGKISRFIKSGIDGLTKILNLLARYNKSESDLYNEEKTVAYNRKSKNIDFEIKETRKETEKQGKKFTDKEYLEFEKNKYNNELKTIIDAEKKKKELIQKNIADSKKIFSGLIKKEREKIEERQKLRTKEIKNLAETIKKKAELEGKLQAVNERLIKKPEPPTPTPTPTPIVNTKNNKNQLKADAHELAKFHIQLEIDKQKEIAENEDASYNERIRAIQEKEAHLIRLAELKEEYLLSNQKLSADARKLIEEETSAELIKIYKKTNSEIEKVKNDVEKNAPEIIDVEEFEGDINIIKQGIKDYAKSLGFNGQDALDEFEKLHGDKFENIKEFYDDLDKRAKESAEIRKQLAKDLKDAVVGFVNVLFERKISTIDEEIEKNDEHYNNLSEKAQTRYDEDGRMLEDGELRKKIIEEEREKKRQQLEKKKREEQRKQAIFNKAVSVFEIGNKTSQAIMSIWAEVPKFDFGVSAGAMTALVSSLGALQLATVLATPLPKYKSGTTAKTPHLAIVGDGGRSEVIEKPTGETYITPATDTITYLEKGDIVHPSLEIFKQRKGFTADNYEEMLRLSRLSDFKKVGKLAQQYQEQVIINNQFNENKMAQAMERNMFLLKGELKSAIVEGFKSVKIHNHNNIDLDDYIGGWERG